MLNLNTLRFGSQQPATHPCSAAFTHFAASADAFQRCRVQFGQTPQEEKEGASIDFSQFTTNEKLDKFLLEATPKEMDKFFSQKGGDPYQYLTPEEKALRFKGANEEFEDEA